MPTFDVELTVTCRVEIAQAVLDGVLTDEWRSRFYPLRTPQDVAHHLAYNWIRNSAGLSNLDGFADQPDSACQVTEEEWE